jgi:hypothetical protein
MPQRLMCNCPSSSSSSSATTAVLRCGACSKQHAGRAAAPLLARCKPTASLAAPLLPQPPGQPPAAMASSTALVWALARFCGLRGHLQLLLVLLGPSQAAAAAALRVWVQQQRQQCNPLALCLVPAWALQEQQQQRKASGQGQALRVGYTQVAAWVVSRLQQEQQQQPRRQQEQQHHRACGAMQEGTCMPTCVSPGTWWW